MHRYVDRIQVMVVNEGLLQLAYGICKQAKVVKKAGRFEMRFSRNERAVAEVESPEV